MGCTRWMAPLASLVTRARAHARLRRRPVAADDNTIVFGAALAATGATAREGELTKEGYEFWKDYVNAHGGLKVGGKTYKVDIKYADDESNPQTAARLVEKFVSARPRQLHPRPVRLAELRDRRRGRSSG